MSFGLAHAAMLGALLAVALPPIIHLLSRRRVPTVEWGAMMFLDPGRRARTRIRLDEVLLMLARMAVLALVALAATRPFIRPDPAQAASLAAVTTNERRDLVIVLDGSAAMDRRGADGTTPWQRALAAARQLVSNMRSGDTAAIIVAADRARPLVDPPRSDQAVLRAALDKAPEPIGPADLPGALAEAFRILESSRNPSRSVAVLTDGRRAPWRADDDGRWRLLRDLHAALPSRPTIRVARFPATVNPSAADGSVRPLEVSRGLVAPGAMLEIRTSILNDGPATLVRTVELLRDGRPEPGASQAVGPLAPGAQASVSFRTRLVEPGAHALAVRLTPDPMDPLPSNDASARPVEVVQTLPVVLVDGEPGREPLSGEADFIRAALAPADDDAPQFQTTTIGVEGLTAEALRGARVAVLANVDRLSPSQTSAIASLLDDGGGVLFVPGDRTDPTWANESLFRDGQGWLPARLGESKGDATRREVVAHPDPSTFAGPLAGLGAGDAPPLARAGLFAYRQLEPAAGESPGRTLARLDNGDPWIVERPSRRGLAAIVAGPLDAEGGTLPVNPDFVPFVHEWIFHLADPAPRTAPVAPGQPLLFELGAALPSAIEHLPVRTPGGRTAEARVERGGAGAVARLDDAGEPGLYQLTLPDPPGGTAYGVVLPDPSSTDPAPLTDSETTRLAEGWPLSFGGGETPLTTASGLTTPRGPRPFWRLLLLAALVGLCIELALTRRMARGAM